MKLKRELGVDASDVQVDHPRPKRRKRGSSVTNEDSEMAAENHEGGANGVEDLKAVAEQGMMIWNAVRNAKGEGQRELAFDFLKLPPRKLYPDYYEFIRNPVCLEDIKKGLNQNKFRTLEAVKSEFDTCFKNATKYNVKGSQIWLDAKALHKIANAEYRSIVGLQEDEETDSTEESEEEDEEWEEEGKANGKGKASRSPNMYRLMKARMDKLVAKRDSIGRLITEIFLELPSKKMYPSYYKIIKRPMCFNMISKRIQEKKYASMAEFAAEVELVFNNATTFNEEHSFVWDDAMTLKSYFKQLMSDVPAPYTLPEYSGQNGKLKLRLPAQSQLNGLNASTNGTGLKVRLPPLAAAQPQPIAPAVQPSPKLPPAPVKQASNSPSIAPKLTPQPQPIQYQQPPPLQQPVAQASSSYLRPANFAQMPTPIQPQPQYQQYIPQPPISQPQSSAQSISPSPLPATPVPPNVTFDHPLRSVTLKTLPIGRTLRLDSSEGVRTWVLQLSKVETKVDILDVKFEEFESDDEDEEYEDEVIVKANGTPIDATVPPDTEDGVLPVRPKWEVSDLRTGNNILEVGEKEGEIWKIVLQRVAVN